MIFREAVSIFSSIDRAESAETVALRWRDELLITRAACTPWGRMPIVRKRRWWERELRKWYTLTSSTLAGVRTGRNKGGSRRLDLTPIV